MRKLRQTCTVCGVPMQPQRITKRYCSGRCRMRALRMRRWIAYWNDRGFRKRSLKIAWDYRHSRGSVTN